MEIMKGLSQRDIGRLMEMIKISRGYSERHRVNKY
jgi:hypothetical protein